MVTVSSSMSDVFAIAGSHEANVIAVMTASAMIAMFFYISVFSFVLMWTPLCERAESPCAGALSHHSFHDGMIQKGSSSSPPSSLHERPEPLSVLSGSGHL